MNTDVPSKEAVNTKHNVTMLSSQCNCTHSFGALGSGVEVSRHVIFTPGPDPPDFGMLAKDGNASN